MKEEVNMMDHFSEVFRDMESSLNGRAESALHQFQCRSLEALQQVQFPGRKHEDWRYTPVQKLIAPKYKLTKNIPSVSVGQIDELDTTIITIINGQIDFPQLPTEWRDLGVQCVPLANAFEDDSWQSVFGKWISGAEISNNRAFEFLNFTFSSSGFFLDIPKNTILTKPIEIRIIHDDPEITFSHPLFFIRCGSNSQLRLIERFESNDLASSPAEDSFINALGIIHMERNSVVRHLKWQNLPARQQLVYKLLVRQFRDSRFETFAFDRGGQLVRNNVEVELEENNTFTSLQGGYFASGKQSMDHQTRINHKVAYCESHELYKGLIDGQSSAAFNGKVFVHKDAQKTNAYQQNDTLVLSSNALMNSKPQLEIYADDVKCSHGATIGQMDEKALFYLKSRGLDERAAKEMLKEAFLAEIIDKIPEEALRSFITKQMYPAS